MAWFLLPLGRSTVIQLPGWPLLWALMPHLFACLSSTRRGGHTLKLLISGPPRLSRLALSVPRTPLILGHLLFPRLLLQILSLLPLCAPTFTIFIESKGLCNPSRERKRKRPKFDVDTYQFLRKKRIRVTPTLNQHHKHTHTCTHTRAHSTLMEKNSHLIFSV